MHRRSFARVYRALALQEQERRRQKVLKRRKYTKHPELPLNLQGRTRSYLLNSRYNITLTDFNRIAAEQGGRCAICDELPRGKKKRPLHVKVDQETKAVRGLVCARCNLGLGMFLQDAQLLQTAADFVEGVGQFGQQEGADATPDDQNAPESVAA